MFSCSIPMWLRTNHDGAGPSVTRRSNHRVYAALPHILKPILRRFIHRDRFNNHWKLIPSNRLGQQFFDPGKGHIARAFVFQYKPIFLFFRSSNLFAGDKGLKFRIAVGFNTFKKIRFCLGQWKGLEFIVVPPRTIYSEGPSNRHFVLVSFTSRSLV